MNELPAENSQSLRPELMESFEEWNQTAGAWPLKRLVAMWNDLPASHPSRSSPAGRLRYRESGGSCTLRSKRLSGKRKSRAGSRFGKARKQRRCMPCCAVRKEQRLARSGN